MQIKRHLIFAGAALALILGSCKKYDAPKPEPMPEPVGGTNYGQLDITVSNVAGSTPVVLNTGNYTNSAGNTFNVSILKYYLTNIVLKKADGTTWTQPDSYYLINQATPSSMSIHIPGVPVANYTEMQFMIGVDAPRNTAGAQTGALDPVNAMFWDWNTGYIMAKLEGTSPQSTDANNKIVFHMGGFTGPKNVLRTVSVVFPNQAMVTKTQEPKVYLKADILEWFQTPTPVDFSTLNHIMTPGTDASMIADNYSDMFTVTAVVN